ncbi:MAG: hypothetical protein ACJZ57_03835 [Candidatus Poriferisodalaceae bacterium]|nr:hypothetical protein [Acidimicrobiaceae bacterium]PDH67369.1 MAG: hypothetical protein CNE88_07840 [Acidimicrobiales bacterium MED-G01]|tara:strand:+ start:7032 stop:7241 length:210 start_codon:yes stop_codon:yes gene_type:complete
MAETQDDSSSESVNEVRTLLGLVGIELAGPDLASLGRIFPQFRQKVDRMYEIDTGDEVTAAVFRADMDS